MPSNALGVSSRWSAISGNQAGRRPTIGEFRQAHRSAACWPKMGESHISTQILWRADRCQFAGGLDRHHRHPLMLLAPALWNGYPLLQWDTGGYLARWYEGYLVPSRSTTFGLYLHFGEDSSFWINLGIQRAGDVVDPAIDAARARHAPAVAAPGNEPRAGADHLLPWLASTLLTDIFAGLSVLSLFILVTHGERTSITEKCLLFGLTAFAAATHSATLAVLLGLCCVGWIVRPFLRGRISVSGLTASQPHHRRRSRVIALDQFRIVRTAGVDARRLRRSLRTDAAGWDRRTVFARSLSAAELQALPLSQSASRHRRPVPVGQQHVQHARPLSRVERRDGLYRAAFARRISGAGRPRRRSTGTAQQLAHVATGEGIGVWLGHTYGIVERFLPPQIKPMRAAQQQLWHFDFTAINRIHVPVALASMLLAAILFGRGVLAPTVRRSHFARRHCHTQPCSATPSSVR